MNEEPVSEKNEGRYLKNWKKDKDRDQCQNLRTRIEKKISSHHPGNRPACANGGHFGIPVCEKMDEARSHAAENIEEKVSNVTKSVLNIVPEDIKEPHISQDVKKSSVEEHGGQKGEPLLEGCKLR